MMGLSWLAVEHTESWPSLLHSQAQPEPKRVVAALAKASLKLSKEPNAALMASASLPEGALAPPGAIIFQNNE